MVSLFLRQLALKWRRMKFIYYLGQKGDVVSLFGFLDYYLFIPLWPFGIVIPIIATIALFDKRNYLIKLVPIICTGIWGLVRIMSTFPLRGERTPEAYDFPFEQLLLIGTIGLILVVLFLSAVSTWITYKILKTLNGYKAR
jgi:hypothetical protein